MDSTGDPVKLTEKDVSSVRLGEGMHFSAEVPPMRFVGGYDDQVVGPNGETRAECRRALLQRLEKLYADVEEAGNNGQLPHAETPGLLLRIHREQAALLGLGIALAGGAF